MIRYGQYNTCIPRIKLTFLFLLNRYSLCCEVLMNGIWSFTQYNVTISYHFYMWTLKHPSNTIDIIETNSWYRVMARANSDTTWNYFPTLVNNRSANDIGVLILHRVQMQLYLFTVYFVLYSHFYYTMHQKSKVLTKTSKAIHINHISVVTVDSEYPLQYLCIQSTVDNIFSHIFY